MAETKAQVQTWLSDDAGQAWQRGAAMRARYMAAPTNLMLQLAALKAGDRVLDVAAGTGDQSIEAARVVGPAGHLLATDNAPSMLRAAESAAREAGLGNIDTRVIDAQDLDRELEADSFDAVICRNGLMFFPDLQKALKAIHRVLKAGCRFSATVWAGPEQNPYMVIPVDVARKRLNEAPQTFTVSVALSLGEPGLLERELTGAGFRDVTVEAVAVNREFESVADAVRSMRSGATPTSQGIARLPQTEQEAAWRDVEQALNRFATPKGCIIPGQSLVGVGTK